MDMFKKITFVRFCLASAYILQEDLGLPTKKLICLYKECIEMAKHCNDLSTMVNSCKQFVLHSNSIGRHADSLRCLKEILPSAVVIPSAEMIVHEYLSMTYEELKEFDNVVLHAKKWIEIARNIGDKGKEYDGILLMGIAFLSLACYDAAIDCGKKCLEIAQEIDSAKGEVMSYNCIMVAYKRMQKHDDTILYAHKYLDCAMKTNDQEAMMNAYLELGEAHLALNHYEDATDFGKKCIEIAREIEDRRGEALAYLLMGEIYKALSDYDNAIIYCKKCIELAITFGDKHAEADAYRILGEVYYFWGKYEDAIFICNKCVHIDIEDKSITVTAYFTLGTVIQALEKYDEAIQNYKQYIDIVNRIGSQKKLAVTACLALGNIYNTLEQYNDAVYYNKKCIDMAQETGEKSIEAQACLHLGNIYETLEQYNDAVYYSKKCIDIVNRIGREKKGAATCTACWLLGKIYQTLKQYDDAVYYSKKCIDMAQETGEKKAEMNGHYRLALAYLGSMQLNDVSLSIDAGMAIATELGNKEDEKKFKEIRCSLYAAVGLLDKACVPSLIFKQGLLEVPTCSEDDLLEDLDQAVKTGDKIMKDTAFIRLYKFYHFKKDHEKAINCLEQFKAMDVDRPVNLFCFIGIGNSYLLMGQNDMALRCFKEGLPTADSCSDNMQRSMFYYGIGQSLFSLNRELNLAEGYLREAIRCFEAIFTTLGSLDEFKISIFDQYIISYKLLAILLIKGKRIEEALLVLDRCRARALKDLIISNFKMEQEGSNDEDLEYSDVLSLVSRNDFSISYYSLSHNAFLKFFLFGGGKYLHFSVCLNYSLHIDVDNSLDEMGVREVVNCEDRSLDKEQLQDIQKEFEQKRSKEEYEGLNQPTASLLNLDSKRGETNENSAETKRYTLEVLFGILECDRILSFKQDEVIIIPEGPLYKVPFPALRDPRTGKYLSKTKRIRLAPSLATLKHFEDFPTDRTSNAKPLIIGSPLVEKVMMDGEERDIASLFGALDEALDIADILGVRPLVLADATKPAVLEKLQEGASIVHIAAHGILSKATIVLAPSPEKRATKIPDEEDYMLTMAEVQQAQVRAQLVVLSCCHSGRGEIRAEGVVGMCRAFIASGARAVVASLWAIDDDATLEFMKKFYHSLKDGKSASASLQQAMEEMRNTTSYSKPKYWAPFFLMGDDVTIKL